MSAHSSFRNAAEAVLGVRSESRCTSSLGWTYDIVECERFDDSAPWDPSTSTASAPVVAYPQPFRRPEIGLTEIVLEATLGRQDVALTHYDYTKAQIEERQKTAREKFFYGPLSEPPDEEATRTLTRFFRSLFFVTSEEVRPFIRKLWPRHILALRSEYGGDKYMQNFATSMLEYVLTEGLGQSKGKQIFLLLQAWVKKLMCRKTIEFPDPEHYPAHLLNDPENEPNWTIVKCAWYSEKGKDEFERQDAREKERQEQYRREFEKKRQQRGRPRRFFFGGRAEHPGQERERKGAIHRSVNSDELREHLATLGFGSEYGSDSMPTPQQIKKHFREAAMASHPDKVGDASTARMQRINEAKDFFVAKNLWASK
jgi:hypothetical protein